MSTTVGQLTIEMAANVARLRADMDDAKRLVGSAVDDMRSTIDVLKMTFAGIGAAISVDAVVGEFKRAGKTMGELDDAAEKAGTSVENISRLLGVAAESGTSLQGVVDATTKLSRAMVNAEKDTSRAAEAFKLLGIDPGTYKDTTDLLIDVARAMYGYEDSAQKTQLALAIFGKSGAELLPLLKDLGAATNLTATHSSEAAAEAEKLEKAFAKMRYESDLAKQQLASELVPWIARMIQQFNEGRTAAGGFWAAMLRYGVGFAPGQGVEEVEKNIARITEQIKLNEEALQIEKSLTDALLRGFEGGKGFAQNLVQSMKNLFNTLILRPVIQAVVQPVAGAITAELLDASAPRSRPMRGLMRLARRVFPRRTQGAPS